MEIRFSNIKYKNENISFKIKDSGIYSFLGNSKSIKPLIGKILNLDIIPYEGDIKITKNIKIGYVKVNPYDMFSKKTVKEELENILKINNYKEKNIKHRVEEALNLVDLDNKYLNKKCNELNYDEAKKISLVCALIHNPKILVLEDYTDNLTYNNRKELSRTLRLLKNRYSKIIILLTKDTVFTYENSDYVYLVNDKEIVKEGDRSILNNTNLLNKLDLEIPPIIKFINECNKNNHEINYFSNILDLIKELYREIT